MSRFVARYFALGITGASLCGCQIYPYFGESIASTTSSITFAGCTNIPSQIVQFEFQDKYNGFQLPFDVIQSSSSVSYTDSQGANWYCWSKAETVPAAAWFGTAAASQAIVRTTLADQNNQVSPTWYFDNDPGQCNKPPGVASMTNQVPCALAPSGSSANWVAICAGSCG
jgi:hypothetical protein